MLDKILGKKEKEKNGPELRKTEKESGSDVSGRIKGIVSRSNGKSKDQTSKLNTKTDADSGKIDSSDKIPRPMPKPRPKDAGRARLRPPEQKKPSGRSGGGGLDRLGGSVPGFGRRSPGGRGPDEDQRTLVGAAVFAVILIVLIGAGYYFLFYAPYQGTLQDAKNTKIDEVNTYYKGALAADPQKLTLLADIESATTPEQAMAVDVLGPATTSWRAYQSNQINTKKDAYGRVMITYTSGDQKDLIVKVAAAQALVTQSDASVLSNLEITTPDTVVIPIRLDRLRAAGGLISVGDTVDIYVNTNATTTTTTSNATNQTNQTSTTNVQTSGNDNASTPLVSGATVLAILRSMATQNDFNASISTSQSIAINTLSTSSSRSQSAASSGIEQLLQAGASRTWDESSINALLNAYGVRLDDFERTSNFGNLDAEYMVLIEVPRDKAIFLIQNQDALQLTISTQNAPSWMVSELHKIYG